jgi:hypothetical protein
MFVGFSLTRFCPARLLKYALVLLLMLNGGVGYSLTRSPQEATNPGKSVPVTRLVVTFGTNKTSIWNGLLSARSRIVVRDRETWDGVWKKIVAPNPYASFPPLPEIDFSRELLVVVGMGQKPSSGYRIIVSSAREIDNRIEVEVQSTSPCGMDLGIMTSPVDIVRLPWTELPVTFREVEVKCDYK